MATIGLLVRLAGTMVATPHEYCKKIVDKCNFFSYNLTNVITMMYLTFKEDTNVRAPESWIIPAVGRSKVGKGVLYEEASGSDSDSGRLSGIVCETR
jgi:hypothetical protein